MNLEVNPQPRTRTGSYSGRTAHDRDEESEQDDEGYRRAYCRQRYEA
jgi:hypothetical protein